MNSQSTRTLASHLLHSHGISGRRIVGREAIELQWLDDYLHSRVSLPTRDEVYDVRALAPSGVNRIPWPKPSYYARNTA